MDLLQELEKLLFRKGIVIRSIKSEMDLNKHIIAMFMLSVVLCAIYGLCIGIYKIQYQIIYVPIKLPVLFIGSFLICLPTLIVFNAILGAGLKPKQTIAIFLMMISTISLVLASFSLINVFMLFTVHNYDIIRIINVLFFVIAGIAGVSNLATVIRTITAKVTNQNEREKEGIICSACGEEVEQDDEFCQICGVKFENEFKKLKSKIIPRRKIISSQWVLYTWLAIYGFVSIQMAWLLRPYFGGRFEGAPPFVRPLSEYGNVFSAILELLR